MVDGRRLQQLVQAIADRDYRAAKDTHDRKRLRETPQQRLADALGTLVRGAEAVENPDAAASTDPYAVRVPTGATQLMVVIPYEQLLDRACERGVLTDGTAVSPGELRRLACQADLIPVVLGTGSTVLDVGHRHRLAPAALRLAVALRDGGCAFPRMHGADAALRRPPCHALAARRSTNLDNTVALCQPHHSLVELAPRTRLPDGTYETVDQWQVRIDSRGLPEFIPPAATDPTQTPIRQIASHTQTLLDTG